MLLEINIQLSGLKDPLTYIEAIAGWFADRSSSRRGPYLLGLVALALSTLALSLGRSKALLFVGRLVQGASSAAVHTVGIAILADTVGKDGIGTAMGFVGTSTALGIVLGPMLGGFLYHQFGYQAVFGSAYVLVGLDFIFRVCMVNTTDRIPERRLIEPGHTNYGTLSSQDDTFNTPVPSTCATGTSRSDSTSSLWSRSRSPSTNSEGSTQDFVAPPVVDPARNESDPRRHAIPVLLTTPRMLVALLGDFSQSLILTGLESILPLRIKTMFHYNSMQVGLVFIALSFGSFAGPAVGKLSDRIGAKITVCFGFGASAPLLVLLRLVDHDSKPVLALLCCLLLLLGVTLNMILTPVWSEASYLVDEIMMNEPGIFGAKGAYGQAFSLMNMAYAIGSLVGPLSGGLLVESAGWNDLTLGIGIFCALCVIPCLWATGGRRQWDKQAFENRQGAFTDSSTDS